MKEGEGKVKEEGRKVREDGETEEHGIARGTENGGRRGWRMLVERETEERRGRGWRTVVERETVIERGWKTVEREVEEGGEGGWRTVEKEKETKEGRGRSLRTVEREVEDGRPASLRTVEREVEEGRDGGLRTVEKESDDRNRKRKGEEEGACSRTEEGRGTEDGGRTYLQPRHRLLPVSLMKTTGV